MPSSPSISAAVVGPATCSRVGTISMLRRGSRRMDGGSHGSPGIIPTCRGTARGSTWARSRKMAQSAMSNPSPAERQNRSSNRNGHPTARKSRSCRIAPAGGISIRSISRRERGVQYWTSRGIAVLDVNYRGSTGFGRAYRDRLQLNWGVIDVDDCVAGAQFLAARGQVDGKRCVISGGSAGGYTTLAALTFRDFFQGGASHYGVSDIAALARDTHKFESRYLDWLIGPYPQEEARYRERSPLYHADGLAKPVIFFQGEEDAVVPPNQAESMVEALRRKGNPVGYFLFSGEQHGFRKAGNIQRCLDAELAFYAIEVFRTGLTF